MLILRLWSVAIGGNIIEVCSPFKEDTAVGRLLKKRGDGGYMIIMQTMEAGKRREYIESKKLAKVIFTHYHGDAQCIQYHPKGIPGGMIPELDAHAISSTNPTPLETELSPWHPCGPDFEKYSAGMKRCSHLKLVNAVLRLAPGQTDVVAAAQRWQDYFGVKRHGSGLEFTNARLKFVPGVDGMPEGLESITIEVQSKDRLEKMLKVASKEGLCGDGWTNLLGIKWYFVAKEDAESGHQRESKL